MLDEKNDLTINIKEGGMRDYRLSWENDILETKILNLQNFIC